MIAYSPEPDGQPVCRTCEDTGLLRTGNTRDTTLCPERCDAAWIRLQAEVDSPDPWPLPDAIEGTVVDGVCGATAGSCMCVLPPHPDTEPHECDPDLCAGSWLGTGRPDGFDGSFRIVRLPGSVL